MVRSIELGIVVSKEPSSLLVTAFKETLKLVIFMWLDRSYLVGHYKSMMCLRALSIFGRALLVAYAL